MRPRVLEDISATDQSRSRSTWMGGGVGLLAKVIRRVFRYPRPFQERVTLVNW